MRWVGEAEFDRVAETRAYCYGGATKDFSRFGEIIRFDRRCQAGDYLLAERDGKPVGTATSLSLNMWMRGASIPCQGIAWVGTIKTQRRTSSTPGGGVATQIMRETLRLGRERGQVVSALMPFRGSFYEHFGYGIVERRTTWTVPVSILPSGPFEGVGFLAADDLPALASCRQRCVEQGQCDVERSEASWQVYLKKWEDGLVAVDQDSDGSIHGFIAFQHVQKNEKDILEATEMGYETIARLKKLLHFLASLRDQYSYVSLTFPADLPLNLLLREPQIPHRLVNHPYAEARPFTRMQIRVLDHRRLIEAMRLPADRSGKVVVAVHEAEGHVSKFAIDIAGGRASAAPSDATPQFECSNRMWAPIVSGDLSATSAARLGLVQCHDPAAAALLDIFAEGPVPFSNEYF